MDFLRKMVVGIACGLLPVVLFGFGLSFSLERVFGKPDSIKHALAESNIYSTATANFVAAAQKHSTEEGGGDVPVNQADIAEIFQKSLPASSIQPQVEKAIDGVYAFAHGDTPTLNISVDLGQNKDNLLANLTAYVKDRAASLPVCPPGTPITADFDAFKATCRPTFVTPEMAAAQAGEKLKQGDFFKESSFNADTIKDENGKTLSDRLSGVPGIYDRIVKAIYITGVLALVFILATIFLSRPWREGLKRVAKIGLSIGGITIALAIFSVFLTSKTAEALAKSAGSTESFQASLVDAIHTLASDVRTWWLGYGILLVILAVAAFLTLKVLSEKDLIERNDAKPPADRPTVVVVN